MFYAPSKVGISLILTTTTLLRSGTTTRDGDVKTSHYK